MAGQPPAAQLRAAPVKHPNTPVFLIWLLAAASARIWVAYRDEGAFYFILSFLFFHALPLREQKRLRGIFLPPPTSTTTTLLLLSANALNVL